MGTSSFVLAGEPGSMELAFGTTRHGGWRTLSRTGPRKRIGGAGLRRELGGAVHRRPDVERVVEVVERAGLARPVAQLAPLGVVKAEGGAAL
jgi:tRNA-splicing ligase RtcB (3'-phosphate/5'-hydroxy nucleic acid ligase)